MRFIGENEPEKLIPGHKGSEGQEWMLYQPEKFGEFYDDEELELIGEEYSLLDMLSSRISTKMKGKSIIPGSLDITTLTFDLDENRYPLKVILAPARTRCLC